MTVTRVSPYANRREAGRVLAYALRTYAGTHPLVLGVPRGGVPVAHEVAQALGGELDVVVARKIGAPWSSELALGAVAADGTRFVNARLLQAMGIVDDALAAATQAAEQAARDKAARFRGASGAPSVAGRTVIVVDDGLATGATMIAAARAVRAGHPARLVVAVPVGSPEGCDAVRGEADVLVCPRVPARFEAVGAHYRDFAQVEDDEVARILADARAARRETPAAAGAG